MPRLADPEDFGFLVTDLARLVRADFDRAVARSGLEVTPGEARALAHAARAGLVRQNVLAERMGVEAMTVTGFLDRLEAKGLIERRPDPADRRAKLVHVREEAHAVLTAIQDLAARTREAASAGCPPEDWRRFMEMLRDARSNLAALRDGHFPGSPSA